MCKILHCANLHNVNVNVNAEIEFDYNVARRCNIKMLINL